MSAVKVRLLGIAAVAVAAGVGGALLVAALREGGGTPLPDGAATEPSPLALNPGATSAPRPVFSPFLNDNGDFSAPNRHDRALSDAEKAADPFPDPALDAFGACMAARGFDVRADRAKRWAMKDVTAITDRVNQQRPEKGSNKTIGVDQAKQLPGIAGAFMTCAYDTLVK